MTSYCPITHLSMTAWPSKSWHHLLLAMFTVCFDSSGHEKEHDHIVVAGFVSSAKVWIEFSNNWNERLKHDGLKYFRGSDCQNWKGEFESWKGQYDRRTGLWCDLAGIIRKSVFRKFVCAMNIPAYKANVSDATKERWKVNAFVLCAIHCAQSVVKCAARDGITAPIKYVFEEGDLGRGMLEAEFIDQGFPRPVFEPKKDCVKQGNIVPGFTPLQAADFLAYECFVVKKLYSMKRRIALTRPMYQFMEILGTPYQFTQEGLARMDKQIQKSMPVKIKGIWRPS